MSKHHKFSKKRRHGFLRSTLAIMGGVIVLLLGAWGVFVATFDINDYRTAIAQTLSEKTGRAIALDGAIAWSASIEDGLSVQIEKVTIGNPAWARRSAMAHIGAAKLHIDFLPLLDKKLDVIAFEIRNADIQLETSASGAVNWTFDTPKAADNTKTEASDSKAQAVTWSIQKAVVAQSKLTMIAADGAKSVYDVPSLSLSDGAKGLRVHFEGKISGVATEVDIAGGALAAITGAQWPFNMKASYGTMDVDARGALNNNIQSITLHDYLLQAGSSKAKGTLSITLNKSRPLVKGTLRSEKLSPSDFQNDSTASDDNNSQATSPSKDRETYVFNREPIAFDGLRAIDLDLDVAIDNVAVGLTSVQKFATKIALTGGRLTLSPITGWIAGSKTDGALTLDASGQTALLSATLRAPDLDLSQLLKLWGMESAFSGKGDMGLTLQSSGKSAHEFASYAKGQMHFFMNNGQVYPSQLKSIAGSLLNLFAPGVGSLTKTGINCMAARYVITNGLMETKGLLIDTDMTTIAGSGYVNLADERINMSLRTRPKGLGLGTLIPPTKVLGPLSAPSFTLDAGGAVQKASDLLMGNGQSDDGVPTLLSVPKGQNACLVTMDNPALAAKAAGSKEPIVPRKLDAEGIKDTVKDVGNTLMKSIGGQLFGQ